MDYQDNNAKDDQDQYEEDLYNAIKIESVVIIVLCSLLASAAFLGFVFFYYTRGKNYWEKFVSDKDWDLPSLPSIKGMPKKPKMPTINWPLSNTQVKKLPQFLKKKSSKPQSDSDSNTKKVTVVSSPISVVSSTNEAATGPVTAKPLPKAPPRAKKNPPPAIPTASNNNTNTNRLATISSRPHPPRPSAPPPVAPGSQQAVLEISHPTSVTINGVSVTESNEVTVGTDSVDNITANGFIVPARPAMADEDMPDSMETSSQQPNETSLQLPPPLPEGPPPQFDDDTSNA